MSRRKSGGRTRPMTPRERRRSMERAVKRHNRKLAALPEKKRKSLADHMDEQRKAAQARERILLPNAKGKFTHGGRPE